MPNIQRKAENRGGRVLRWSLIIAALLAVHFYVYYVRPLAVITDDERRLMREAIVVCVDMPLIDWIPFRYTPVRDETGDMRAIDAGLFYGVVPYRINLRTMHGRLKGCSIEF